MGRQHASLRFVLCISILAFTALLASAESSSAEEFSASSTDPSLSIYCEFDPPFQFLDASGSPTGYAVGLVREIQKRVGNTDPIEIVPWARGHNDVLKKPNIVLFSMARTAERENLFRWVGLFPR